jgi:hypothetical protein
MVKSGCKNAKLFFVEPLKQDKKGEPGAGVGFLVRLVPAILPLIIVIDETIER